MLRRTTIKFLIFTLLIISQLQYDLVYAVPTDGAMDATKICCEFRSFGDYELLTPADCDYKIGFPADMNKCVAGENELKIVEDQKNDPYATIKTNLQTNFDKAKFKDPNQLIGRLILFLYPNIGAAALLIYIYAGFLWMTAAGNAENIATAVKLALWTTLGLVALFGSYMIVKFLFSTVLFL